MSSMPKAGCATSTWPTRCNDAADHVDMTTSRLANPRVLSCQAIPQHFLRSGGCGAPSPCGQLASTDLLQVLAARGHEIGCHTYSHAAVAAIGARELAADTERNHAFLVSVSGRIAVRNFAYPY